MGGLQLIPSRFPIAIMQSLVAIAQYVPGEGKPVDTASVRTHSLEKGVAKGMLQATNDEDAAAPELAKQPGNQFHDSLRRVVIDTIRSALLVPEMTHVMSACSADIALVQLLLEFAGMPSESVRMHVPLATTAMITCFISV